jgi:hypothetical protein
VWAEDGTLYFLSDRSGFWNLYRWRAGAVEPVLKIAADLGGPLWTLGASSYAVASNELALVRICRAAVDALAVIDLKTGSATELPLPQRTFSSIGILMNERASLSRHGRRAGGADSCHQRLADCPERRSRAAQEMCRAARPWSFQPAPTNAMHQGRHMRSSIRPPTHSSLASPGPNRR